MNCSRKMPANLFSLGAIDFGIIVDGAIVVTEAILRRREAKPAERTHRGRRALGDASQVARPIFFATLIIITAYLPLFAFERAEAKLFTPMAYTVGYALLGALLCTLVADPRPGLHRVSQAAASVPQPAAAVAARRATRTPWQPARPSADRLR